MNLIREHVTVQRLAFLYALMFAGLVAMNFLPFLYAENGRVFGSFKLEPIGNILHVISGAWVLWAALYSREASLFYFRVFGTAYFLDGIVGIVFGRAYLNLRLFDPSAIPVAEMSERLTLNFPHIVIGGAAMFIGFYLYKKLK